MYCPITFASERVLECYIECPWACITPQGYGCSIAFNAIRGEANNVGINLEVLPEEMLEQEEEVEDEVS